MPVDPCLLPVRKRLEKVPELGHPQLDRYLVFVASRCRPNTVLATASDLRAFFGRRVHGNRAGGPSLYRDAELGGLSTAGAIRAASQTAVQLTDSHLRWSRLVAGVQFTSRQRRVSFVHRRPFSIPHPTTARYGGT